MSKPGNNPLNVIVSIVAALLCSPSVYGASFDCTKASSNVEKIICTDNNLSRLDSELDVNYKKALATSSNESTVRITQKKWLAERNKCIKAVCIWAAYEKRIYELKRFASMQERAHDAKNGIRGEFVLRASEPLVGDTTNYREFCASFTDNLNEFRNLDFDTCDARLSPKYPRFSRPQWEEIPLDMDIARKVLTDRPSVGFKNWFAITQPARAAGDVKLWRIQVDLLNDGQLDTLVRLDHAGDGTRPFCSYIDSMQMIVDIPDPKAAKWYAHAQFYNFYRLGGDMIYDASTTRYYLLDWNQYGEVPGEGIPIDDIGATASVMVYGANLDGVQPQCWIDWVPSDHRKADDGK